MSYYVDGQGNNSSGGPRTPANTGSAPAPANPSLLTVTGGLAGVTGQLLMPVIDMVTGSSYLSAVDPLAIDSEEAAFFNLRIEEVDEDAFITVERLALTYRDIGKATISCTIYCADGTSTTDTQVIGTDAATGRIMRALFSLTITGQFPQLKISRAAKSGPFALIRATMYCSTGDAPQF